MTRSAVASVKINFVTLDQAFDFGSSRKSTYVIRSAKF